ncbi:mechanosensitive ion channel domain-containing protein [Vulcanisaeta thermophila]|uniref:mechanosensitive ion channel domain-containing protein n=1 Tax=Vulcanisaeta thermophila TaxID=867917 RepID=UPI000852D8F4|nr:mechanosensitive ion channel domain-containing protein [Vulcanisaeta thermophila]
MSSSGGGTENIARNISTSLAWLIVWIAVYMIVAAIVNSVLPQVLSPIFNYRELVLKPYGVYINIVLALIFGYMIVKSFANFMYWSMRVRYPHQTAAAIRSIVTILGIGALLASIAGGVAGGAAGVALGGFLALVIGFASQQVLGQAVAGMFILLTRPFKIGDYVNIVGEQGTVEDITALFTYVRKDDNTLVLIPSASIIGNKIYHLKKAQ